MDKQKERMGIGVRIKDDIGEVLATLSPPKDHIIAFDVTKAMAALQTITFSRELRFYMMVLKGDAL